jgi:hypothetical protein
MTRREWQSVDDAALRQEGVSAFGSPAADVRADRGEGKHPAKAWDLAVIGRRWRVQTIRVVKRVGMAAEGRRRRIIWGQAGQGGADEGVTQVVLHEARQRCRRA